MNEMETICDLTIFRPVQIDGLKPLGNKFDGGYVVHGPSLTDARALINYGVGYNVEFEKDFFKETRIPVLAFDPTLKSLRLVIDKLKDAQFVPFLRHLKNYVSWKFREGTLSEYGITYVEEGLAPVDDKDFKTLAYHLDKRGLAAKDIILKIDIEGAEYPVFKAPSVYPLLSNAIQVIFEFHEVQAHLEELINIVNKLLKTHALIRFQCVYV